MPSEQKIKILCVEDEKEIRDNIAEILTDEGFEVFTSDNGKHGFQSFMQNKPDLVISDILMPEVDGYTLLQMIRESKNVRNNAVPFIFLTALGQKDDVLKGVSLSANDYLIKPIDFDLMIAKIKEKTVNALKVREVNDRSIKNIKNQVAFVLPGELFSYLDIISKISSMLKREPYGPFPHRKYLEDIDKIYINSMKLKSVITNALDSKVIDHKLSADEEIFSIVEFIDEFIKSLSSKLKSKIEFHRPFDLYAMPRVKTDRLMLLDVVRKIMAGMFKTDPESTISISAIIDPFNQMILALYFKSGTQEKLQDNIDINYIKQCLEKQSCRLDIVEEKEKSISIIIPSYRLIEE